VTDRLNTRIRGKKTLTDTRMYQGTCHSMSRCESAADHIVLLIFDTCVYIVFPPVATSLVLSRRDSLALLQATVHPLAIETRLCIRAVNERRIVFTCLCLSARAA